MYPQKVIIKPRSRLELPTFREFTENRDILYFLVWRDIKIRYKQTLLGVAWVVLQPLVNMIIIAVIFGRFARLPSEGYPYTVFTLVALLPWQLFAYALAQTTDSLIANEKLITKIYFPRILIPLAPVFSGFFDFMIATVLLGLIMLYYQIPPGISLLLLPVFALLAMIMALGVGLWFTALNVRFRDVRYAVPFISQVWFYLTPVAYSAALIPEKWRSIYWLNPMAGVAEGFRWAILNTPAPDLTVFAISSMSGLLVLFSGVLYFQRVESEFADII